MSYDDYFQGFNQEFDIQQIDQFEGNQQNCIQNKQFLQILDPNIIEDPGFVFLLQETNILEIEEAILQDISMFFTREAKLYNHIANLLQLLEIDTQSYSKHINQLNNLLKMFFQIHEIGQNSQFTSQLAQQYDLKDFKSAQFPQGFLINSDQSLINLLIKIILSEEILNKENDYFSQIRIYLPRFIIFSINPPQPFLSRTQFKLFQSQIINKINKGILQTNFEKPFKLDLLALSYLSDPKLDYVLFRETLQNLRSKFESLLKKNSDQIQTANEIQNLTQFFLVFTTNKQLMQYFFQLKFHHTLYQYIKQSIPIQKSIKISCWSKDPLIIQQIVCLIVRILSSNEVDQEFINKLQEDFILDLQHQKLNLITKVILPILNSEQVQLIPVCFHPILSVAENKIHTDQFLSNQTKPIINQTSLQSEFLTKNQCDKITQLVQVNLNKNEQQQQQQYQQKKQKNQSIKQTQNQTKFQQTNFKQRPSNQFQQIQPIPVQQKQNIIDKKQITGSWIHLHSFSAFNPHFDSKILTKILENRNNILFIFELMVEQENVKLACFVNQIIQDGRKQNNVQIRSNESSFYVMMVQDKHFWCVNAFDGTSHILLDIQENMIQIFHHNEPIAQINFTDFQECKFGFPFQKLKKRTILMDQINIALQNSNCYLLSIEIHTIDINNESLFEDYIQSLNNNYYKIINYYYSQLRMQPIHFIPNTITIKELNQYLNENIDIEYLIEKQINDINVIRPVTQQIQIKYKSYKPMLLYFLKKIGGINVIIEQVKINMQNFQAEKQIQDLIFELSILCQNDAFQEQIIQSEGFLYQLLDFGNLNKKQDNSEIYQKFNLLIYQQLTQLLKDKPFLKIIFLVEHKILPKIVVQIDQYLNLINQNGADQPQRQVKFDESKGQLLKNHNVNQKKNHKMIEFQAYQIQELIFSGLSKQYNEQQLIQQYKQQLLEKQKAFNLQKKQHYKDDNLENLLNCLIQLLDLEFINVIALKCVQQSNIINLLIKYLQNINIKQIEGSKTFIQILQIIECLAQRGQTLQLFIQKDGICLFRELESFNTQLIIFIKTFNSKIEEFNKFITLYQYVENCLYAAQLITIKYLSQDQQNNSDSNIIVNKHLYYRPFMKKFAVGKCEIKTDADYISNMKGFQLYILTNNQSQIKIQKLVSEISRIEENLPFEATNSIFITYDNDRIDCMRTIIFGASGTPYAYGAFLYDMFFGDDYPQRPPKIKLATTGHGNVRFNPNLFDCGKICSSFIMYCLNKISSQKIVIIHQDLHSQNVMIKQLNKSQIQIQFIP